MADLKDTPPSQCKATARSGNRCKRRPIPGGTVCVMHGGKAPAVQAAAQRRLEERKALLAVETLGLPREVDPHTALLEELHRTAGAVEWLGAVVADLKRSSLTWGQTRRKTGGEDHGVTYEAGPNTWYELWMRERRHLLDVSKTCIGVGIEERRVRLAEDAGKQLAGVVRAVLDRLDLSPEQRTLSLTVGPEAFRALEAAVEQAPV